MATITRAERDQMAKSGVAMSDGSYPIRNADELKAAIRLVGNGNAPKAEVVAHIKKRARALGLESMIPDEWRSAATDSRFEVRSLLEPPEFRSEGTKLTASGIAMRYGTKSKPIRGQFREQFVPGAFTKTIQEQDIQSHNEHDGPYLGRTGNGTLRLHDSRSELAYELDLPDTSAGRDAAHLLERQDIKGSSIGFRAIPRTVTWSVDDDGMALRSVGQARLGRVDLTILPYYDDSTAALALRSLAEDKGIELRSVLEAADRGELPTLISSEEDDFEQRSDDDDGRETPTARLRIASLYL